MLVGTFVSREDEDLLGVGGFQAAVLRRLEATCAASQCPSPVTGASQSGRAEPVPAVAECLTHAQVSLRLSHGTARPQQHPKTLRRAQTRTGTLALLKRGASGTCAAVPVCLSRTRVCTEGRPTRAQR